jgi:glycerol kinase
MRVKCDRCDNVTDRNCELQATIEELEKKIEYTLGRAAEFRTEFTKERDMLLERLTWVSNKHYEVEGMLNYANDIIEELVKALKVISDTPATDSNYTYGHQRIAREALNKLKGDK